MACNMWFNIRSAGYENCEAYRVCNNCKVSRLPLLGANSGTEVDRRRDDMDEDKTGVRRAQDGM